MADNDTNDSDQPAKQRPQWARDRDAVWAASKARRDSQQAEAITNDSSAINSLSPQVRLDLGKVDLSSAISYINKPVTDFNLGINTAILSNPLADTTTDTKTIFDGSDYSATNFEYTSPEALVNEKAMANLVEAVRPVYKQANMQIGEFIFQFIPENERKEEIREQAANIQAALWVLQEAKPGAKLFDYLNGLTSEAELHARILVALNEGVDGKNPQYIHAADYKELLSAKRTDIDAGKAASNKALPSFGRILTEPSLNFIPRNRFDAAEQLKTTLQLAILALPTQALEALADGNPLEKLFFASKIDPERDSPALQRIASAKNQELEILANAELHANRIAQNEMLKLVFEDFSQIAANFSNPADGAPYNAALLAETARMIHPRLAQETNTPSAKNLIDTVRLSEEQIIIKGAPTDNPDEVADFVQNARNLQLLLLAYVEHQNPLWSPDNAPVRESQISLLREITENVGLNSVHAFVRSKLDLNAEDYERLIEETISNVTSKGMPDYALPLSAIYQSVATWPEQILLQQAKLQLEMLDQPMASLQEACKAAGINPAEIITPPEVAPDIDSPALVEAKISVLAKLAEHQKRLAAHNEAALLGDFAGAMQTSAEIKREIIKTLVGQPDSIGMIKQLAEQLPERFALNEPVIISFDREIPISLADDPKEAAKQNPPIFLKRHADEEDMLGTRIADPLNFIVDNTQLLDNTQSLGVIKIALSNILQGMTGAELDAYLERQFPETVKNYPYEFDYDRETNTILKISVEPAAPAIPSPTKEWRIVSMLKRFVGSAPEVQEPEVETRQRATPISADELSTEMQRARANGATTEQMLAMQRIIDSVDITNEMEGALAERHAEIAEATEAQFIKLENELYKLLEAHGISHLSFDLSQPQETLNKIEDYLRATAQERNDISTYQRAYEAAYQNFDAAQLALAEAAQRSVRGEARPRLDLEPDELTEGMLFGAPLSIERAGQKVAEATRALAKAEHDLYDAQDFSKDLDERLLSGRSNANGTVTERGLVHILDDISWLSIDHRELLDTATREHYESLDAELLSLENDYAGNQGNIDLAQAALEAAIAKQNAYVDANAGDRPEITNLDIRRDGIVGVTEVRAEEHPLGYRAFVEITSETTIDDLRAQLTLPVDDPDALSLTGRAQSQISAFQAKVQMLEDIGRESSVINERDALAEIRGLPQSEYAGVENISRTSEAGISARVAFVSSNTLGEILDGIDLPNIYDVPEDTPIYQANWRDVAEAPGTEPSVIVQALLEAASEYGASNLTADDISIFLRNMPVGGTPLDAGTFFQQLQQSKADAEMLATQKAEETLETAEITALLASGQRAPIDEFGFPVVWVGDRNYNNGLPQQDPHDSNNVIVVASANSGYFGGKTPNVSVGTPVKTRIVSIPRIAFNKHLLYVARAENSGTAAKEQTKVLQQAYERQGLFNMLAAGNIIPQQQVAPALTTQPRLTSNLALGSVRGSGTSLRFAAQATLPTLNTGNALIVDPRDLRIIAPQRDNI